jgi:DNA-binding protein YbaB
MLNPKEILRMQSEAKKMQKQLREKKISGESKDSSLKIYMNGAQEFEDIYMDDQLLESEDLDLIKKRMKEAFKDYQKKLQKQMAQDMDIDSLKSMFS